MRRNVSKETAHVSPKISGLRVQGKDQEPSPIMNVSEAKTINNYFDVLGTEKNDFKYSAKSKTTARSSNAKKSQPNSPRGPWKLQQSGRKKQFYEAEMCLTMNSSAASSKFKTTVPKAPVFTCIARLERRKQFYSELEEKQAVVEAERLESEARLKEKEEAMIRQIRKKVFRANPMPSFYQEGPPPKSQLKKLPVTRAKSPKWNRGKGCGDVMSHSTSGGHD